MVLRSPIAGVVIAVGAGRGRQPRARRRAAGPGGRGGRLPRRGPLRAPARRGRTPPSSSSPPEASGYPLTFVARAPVVDPRDGTIAVWLVPEAGTKLQPGLTGRVVVTLPGVVGASVVPARAVALADGQDLRGGPPGRQGRRRCRWTSSPPPAPRRWSSGSPPTRRSPPTRPWPRSRLDPGHRPLVGPPPGAGRRHHAGPHGGGRARRHVPQVRRAPRHHQQPGAGPHPRPRPHPRGGGAARHPSHRGGHGRPARPGRAAQPVALRHLVGHRGVPGRRRHLPRPPDGPGAAHQPLLPARGRPRPSWGRSPAAWARSSTSPSTPRAAAPPSCSRSPSSRWPPCCAACPASSR